MIEVTREIEVARGIEAIEAKREILVGGLRSSWVIVVIYLPPLKSPLRSEKLKGVMKA